MRARTLRRRRNSTANSSTPLVAGSPAHASDESLQQRPWAGDADAAGGPAVEFPARNLPKICLTGEGLLAQLCRTIPLVCLLGLFIPLVVSLFFEKAFCFVTAALTCYIMGWSASLAVWSAVGARRMQRECAEDWHGKLLQLEGSDNIVPAHTHIVILPNYCENQEMLQETIENIAKSPLARHHIRVVLAMEAREGAQACSKAAALIAETSHHFKGMIATYHPAGRQNEVPGKSSNTQWAFREALRQFEPEIKNFDRSRVFLTIGDSDTLWNPQYFSALAYKALCMPTEKRETAIWQTPVLLFRNLFSVPGTTRVSGYGTLLFELAGLSNQVFAPHLCYSAYSLTLALALHPEVGGWDTDVIAEDHHMFCKCYFAHLWDQAHDMIESTQTGVKPKPIEGKLTLQAIYLPALGYLVEDKSGYFASVWARFIQARRHSEGVGELGYLILQYIKLVTKVGVFGVAKWTHVALLNTIWRLVTVHLIASVQALCLMFATILMTPHVISWVVSGGLSAGIEYINTNGFLVVLGSISSFQFAVKALVVAFGPLPPVAFISAWTNYIAVRDMLQGLYFFSPRLTNDESVDIPKQKVAVKLCFWEKLKLFHAIQFDMSVLAEPTLILYGILPVTLAAWSVLNRGCKFEYVVGTKPVKANSC